MKLMHTSTSYTTRNFPAALPLIAVIVFLFLAAVINRIGELPIIDAAVHSFFAARYSPALGQLASAFAMLGNMPGTLVLTLCFVAALSEENRWPRILGFVAVIVGIGIVLFAIKPAIGRLRPPSSSVSESGFSFPSGHATATMSLWLYVAWLGRNASRSIRTAVIALVVIIPFFTGLSRLYLGVHWLSDVLAGWSIGVVIAAFAINAARFATRPRYVTPFAAS